MSHTNYRHLTDAEFLRVAEDAQDPLTATDVQTELLERFERALTDLETLRDIEANCEELGIDVKEMLELLGVADEFHCTDFDSLRAKLQRADKFYDIAEEAGDAFKQLAELAATTL
jgi:hypothetical protein